MLLSNNTDPKCRISAGCQDGMKFGRGIAPFWHFPETRKNISAGCQNYAQFGRGISAFCPIWWGGFFPLNWQKESNS